MVGNEITKSNACANSSVEWSKIETTGDTARDAHRGQGKGRSERDTGDISQSCVNDHRMSGHGKRVDRRSFMKASAAVGTAGLVGVAGCTGGGGGGTFAIGMANSQTGSLSTFGERNQRGKKLALADVNEVGLRGGKLKIIEEDTQSQSSQGVAAAQRLVNQEGVPLLIGAVSSGVSVAIYESVIQGSEVDQISQNSTSPVLSDFPELLRMSPRGRAQASAIADLVEGDDHDSVAVTYVNDVGGKAVANAFRESYEGSIEYFQSHTQGESSYSDVVTAMNDSGAEAWVFITFQPEFTTMGKDAFDRGYTPPVYGGDAITGSNVLEQSPNEFLEGMKAVVPSAAVSQDNYKQFASRFQEEFGREQPTSWATYCYDAIVTASLAIEAADEFSASAIRNDLIKDVTRPPGKKVTTYQAAHDVIADGGSASDINYQGVSGPIDLNDTGDPRAFLKVLTVRDGEYETTGIIKGD